MNTIKISALILFSFGILHADTPTNDSVAYKIMRVENFINCHHHFFNILKHSTEIAVSALALKGMYNFHNELYTYMKNECENFNDFYTSEIQLIKPNWLFPWIIKSQKNNNGGVHGDKQKITSPCYIPAAICTYLIARGSYGICKEVYSVGQECITTFKKKQAQK